MFFYSSRIFSVFKDNLFSVIISKSRYGVINNLFENRRIFLRNSGENFKTLISVYAIYPIIIPAIVADRSEAIEPPISAFIPNSDKVFRCPGAKDPMPPI